MNSTYDDNDDDMHERVLRMQKEKGDKKGINLPNHNYDLRGRLVIVAY